SWCLRASKDGCPTRAASSPYCISCAADCGPPWATPAAVTSPTCAPSRGSCASPPPACAKATSTTSPSPRRRPTTGCPSYPLMASVPRAAASAAPPRPDIHAHRILILDFGAQYTQLIARRVRELGVYCEIHPWDMSDAEVRAFGPRAVILS